MSGNAASTGVAVNVCRGGVVEPVVIRHHVVRAGGICGVNVRRFRGHALTKTCALTVIPTPSAVCQLAVLRSRGWRNAVFGKVETFPTIKI